jgi:hypothetical protein
LDAPPVPPAAPPSSSPSSLPSPRASTTGLQFDTADFGSDAAPLTCAGCKQPIAGEYYEVNGQTFCPTCKSEVERMFGGTPGPSGLMRAMAFGLGGGVLGALLYFLVVKFSGYQLGLIAIAVGWLVGQGVRMGTGGRGGALYQTIAIVITYLAIVTSFVPMVLEGAHRPPARPAAAAGDAARESPADARDPEGDSIPVVAVVLIVLAAPFLLLFQGSFTIVFVAIGVYEAWRLNKRLRLTVNGPLSAGGGRPALVPSGATASGLPSA